MEQIFVVNQKVPPRKAGQQPSWEFKTIVPITPQNVDHERETEEEQWYKAYRFYVLLPEEIKSGRALPYTIMFKSTSYKAGSKLNTTMFMKNLKAGLTPASYVMELIATRTTNDKGTFLVLDVKEKRKSTDEEVKAALDWLKTVRGGNTKVDDSHLAEEVSEGTLAPESNDF